PAWTRQGSPFLASSPIARALGRCQGSASTSGGELALDGAYVPWHLGGVRLRRAEPMRRESQRAWFPTAGCDREQPAPASTLQDRAPRNAARCAQALSENHRRERWRGRLIRW